MFEVTPLSNSKSRVPQDLTDLELAQALVERNLIAHQDWHRLKGNRKAQAKQQLTSALVFLLQNRSEEALERINQTAKWLDGSLKSPPCPDAHKKSN